MSGDVQVIYEDDDLLAVSKPPFVPTAPRHRWEVCCRCVLGRVQGCHQMAQPHTLRASFLGLITMRCGYRAAAWSTEFSTILVRACNPHNNLLSS